MGYGKAAHDALQVPQRFHAKAGCKENLDKQEREDEGYSHKHVGVRVLLT